MIYHELTLITKHRAEANSRYTPVSGGEDQAEATTNPVSESPDESMDSRPSEIENMESVETLPTPVTPAAEPTNDSLARNIIQKALSILSVVSVQ